MPHTESYRLSAASYPGATRALTPDPATATAARRRPASGGQRFPYYGGAFVEQVVGPGARRPRRASSSAPDLPTASWTDANAERAVMTLVREVMNKYSVDSRRVAGRRASAWAAAARGTWPLRHTDSFSAAIVNGDAPGNVPADRLAASADLRDPQPRRRGRRSSSRSETVKELQQSRPNRSNSRRSRTSGTSTCTCRWIRSPAGESA